MNTDKSRCEVAYQFIVFTVSFPSLLCSRCYSLSYMSFKLTSTCFSPLRAGSKPRCQVREQRLCYQLELWTFLQQAVLFQTKHILFESSSKRCCLWTAHFASSCTRTRHSNNRVLRDRLFPPCLVLFLSFINRNSVLICKPHQGISGRYSSSLLLVTKLNLFLTVRWNQDKWQLVNPPLHKHPTVILIAPASPAYTYAHTYFRYGIIFHW